MRRTLVLFVLLGGCFESIPVTASDDDGGGGTSTGGPRPGVTESTTTSLPADDGGSGESSSTGWLDATGTTWAGSSSSTGFLGSSSTGLVPIESAESSTSAAPETTGPAPDECGNDELDPGEACDEGRANGVELGDCSPDCSAYVQQRVIVVSDVDYDSAFAFGSDAVVAILDAGCAAEFGDGARALFAYGDERRATDQPYAAEGAIDWVLEPWTRYLNDDGDLVWLTEDIALLGVDAEGALHDLVHPLWIYPENNPAFTGMNTDWTTQDDADCNGWTSSAGGPMASGNPWFVGDWDFLRLPGLSTCGNSRGIYCVLP